MQPKIYSLEDHLISHDKIDSHAYYIIEKLRTTGYSSYLVGGSVRDLILHHRPKDFDVSTAAKPEQIKSLFRKNTILIGRRFRLAHVRFGRKIIEVSTFRSGDIDDSALIVKDNEWGTAEEDVLRRDFTINGLYYDPETQRIIDYVGGYEDAKAKLLKTIGTPELRFKQDPVRMIRLLKFKARFDLDVEKHTLAALNTCKEEIMKSSPARILEELMRMLESGSSKAFFMLLKEHSFMKLLLPSLEKELGSKKNHIAYDFLEQADSIVLKHFPDALDRSVLLSGLLFGIFDEKIKIMAEKMEDIKTLHLGKIAEAARVFIHDSFDPFFLISRKLKAQLISILTNQYRLLPIDNERAILRRKIPRDEFFYLAVDFFKIRSMLDESLLQNYTKWNEALMKSHQHKAPTNRRTSYYSHRKRKPSTRKPKSD